MRLVVIIIIFLLSLTGCIAEKPDPEKTEWKVSPLFKSGSYTMIGVEGKLGFLYNDTEVDRFYPHKKQRYMWHLWGVHEDIQGSLKVIGTSKEGGDKITVFSAAPIGGPHNGADGIALSYMTLPSPGLWRLDAFIGEKLFGSIIVEVHENSEKED
jgi:hypothetical protein